MTYFLLLGVAFSLGIIAGGRNAETSDIRFAFTSRYVLATILGSLFAARLFHVIFEGHLNEYMSDPWRALQLWSGGLSVWGGLIGALAATMLLFRNNLRLLAKLHDCFAPSFALGLSITRVGCFFSGCCYGRVTDVPWAVTYAQSSLAYYWQKQGGWISRYAQESLPVHPTQLYEAFGALMIAIAGQLAFNRPRFRQCHGAIALFTLSAYAVLRFAMEFYRADERGSSVLGLSTPQVIAVMVGVICIPLLSVLYFRKPLTK